MSIFNKFKTMFKKKDEWHEIKPADRTYHRKQSIYNQTGASGNINSQPINNEFRRKYIERRRIAHA